MKNLYYQKYELKVIQFNWMINISKMFNSLILINDTFVSLNYCI